MGGVGERNIKQRKIYPRLFILMSVVCADIFVRMPVCPYVYIASDLFNFGFVYEYVLIYIKKKGLSPLSYFFTADIETRRFVTFCSFSYRKH